MEVSNQTNQKLLDSAKKGDLQGVIMALNNRADINSLGTNKRTALMFASWNGYIDIMKTLVNAKANIFLQDSWGWTPLLAAVYHGKVDASKFLVDVGSEINIQDYWGETPLIMASQFGFREIMDLLIAKANLNIQDNYGHTALHHVSSIKGAEMLIDAGADMEIKNKQGFTPADWIKMRGRNDIANYIMHRNSHEKLKIVEQNISTNPLDIAILG